MSFFISLNRKYYLTKNMKTSIKTDTKRLRKAKI